jgi:NDP-sugar pyrophosphorylase family protein
LAPIADRSRYGTVEFEPATRLITRFAEKAAEAEAGPGWVSAGAYVVERALLDLVTPGRPCSIERDVFPRALAEAGGLLAHPCRAAFYDIGTPESWRAFAAFFEGEAFGGSDP